MYKRCLKCHIYAVCYTHMLYIHVFAIFAAVAYIKEFKAFMTVVSSTLDLFEVDLSSSVYSVV